MTAALWAPTTTVAAISTAKTLGKAGAAAISTARAQRDCRDGCALAADHNRGGHLDENH
ncbi:hypothetical protein [Mycobacterium intermedium]|uniref:hypothetical protein n=1 Tax=Mycobacterium intermedium TaxID=28445 RepID=UPI0012EA151B|nr:hypothetical protein [Mycobacterium intermedium]